MILPPLADESARSQFTQWANRSSWLYGCDLETEWRQAREEGRDLSSVEAEFERLNFNEPAANPRERLIAGRRDLRWFEDALGLIDRVQTLPFRGDYPFVEPDALEAIRRERGRGPAVARWR